MFREKNNSVKKQSIALLVSTLFVLQPLAGADLQLEGSSVAGHAYSDTARNGVPIVNIAKPSGGVSHNKYINFNVSSTGLILNNGNTDTKTQLGGIIYGNLNVKDAQANTILNEVTGSNRSHINGYIEVGGKSADVIVSNPRGITVNGGGFINTPQATLRAEGSDITIEGNGLDASTTGLLQLNAGRVNVNAKVNANSLTINAGSGGIDSSALGGLYANVITLNSSAAGVGVNLPGEILSQSALNIDSNGDIVLGKAVSNGSATLTSRSGDISITQGMHAVDLTLSASDVKLKGNTGASRNLTIRSSNLVNDTILAAGVNPDFSEGSAGVLTLEIGNTITNNDTLFGKGGIKITAQELTNARGAVILTNDLESNIANGIKNDGEIFTDGSTTVDAGAIENNGSIHSGGNLSLASDTSINNDAGTIESLGESEIVAQGDILSNKGIIYSQEAASVESTNFIAGESTNIFDAEASMNVSETTNIQNAYVQSNTLNLNTQDLVAVSAEVTSSGDITFTTNTMVADSSTISTAENIDITATTSMSNDNSAILYAGGDIDITTGDLSHTDASLMQSGGDTTIEASSIDNTQSTIAATNYSSTGETLANNEGIIYASQELTASTQTLENKNGLVQADGANTLTATVSLDNTQGEIYANETLDITGGDITNDQGIVVSSEGKVTLSADNMQSNDSTIAGAGVEISAMDITANRSTIESSQALSVTASGDVSMDETALYANSDTTLHATGDVSLNDATLYSHIGKTEVSASSLYAERLVLSGETSVSVETQGTTNLNESEIVASEDVTVSSGGATSLNSASVHSIENSVSLSGDSLQASGASMSADKTLDVVVNNDVTAQNSKFLSNEALALSGGNTNIDGSTLYSQSASVKLATENLSAMNTLMSAETSTSVDAQGDANLDGAEVVATGDVTVTGIGATLLNSANVYSTDSSVAVTSQSLQANDAVFNANRALDITVANDVTAENSVFVSNDTLTFNGGNTDIDGSTLYSKSASVGLSTTTLSAQNTLLSGETSITVTTAQNANLNDAEVSAVGDVTLHSGGDTSLNNANVYSTTNNVTLSSEGLEASDTNVSAHQALSVTSTQDITAQNSRFIANDALTFSGANTNIDGSTLYSQNSSVGLSTTNLSAQNALLSAETSISVDAQGDANVDGAEIAATGEVALISGGAILLNNTSVYSVKESVTLQGDSMEGNGSLLSAGKQLNIDVGNDATLTHTELIATENIRVNAGDTMLDGSVLYSDNGVIALQTDDLSANDVYVETNNTVSMKASGHAALNGATLKGRTLEIDVSGDIVANDATLLSDGTLEVTANSLTHSNGYIASEGAMKLTLANYLKQLNESNIQSFDTLNVITKDYTTSGDALLYAAKGVDIYASGTINHTDGSRILSDDKLDIDANTMNQTDALTYGKTSNIVTTQTYNSDQAVMLGEGNITTATFSNTGGFESNSNAFTIDASSAINNHGLLSVNGNLTLLTQTLNNSNGEIESGGNLRLESDTLNVTSGRVFATNNLTLTSQITGMNSNSQILSGGGMDLTFKGNTNTQGEIIANASDGQTSHITVEGNLNNDAKLNTGATLVLNADTVTNTNRIQSAGSMEATFTGSLNNSHFFTSGSDMNLKATSVTNSGGLASADTMTIRTGSINNTQTIYSGRDMNLLVSGGLTNRKEIYSGGTLSVSANESGAKSASISNIDGTIESYGDMDLNAHSILNQGSASLSYVQTWVSALTGDTITEADLLAWVREADTDLNVKSMDDETLKNYIMTRLPIVNEWKKYGDEQFTEVNKYLAALGLLDKVEELYGDVPHRTGSSGLGDDDEKIVLAPFVVAETQVTGGAAVTPAYLISGGNMYFNAGTLLNKDATISSGGNMVISASSVQNAPSTIEVENYAYTAQVGWKFIDNSWSTNDDTAVQVHSFGPVLSGTTSRIEAVSQILVGGSLSGTIGNFQNGGQSIAPTAPSTNTSTSQTNESQANVSGNTDLASVSGVDDQSFSAIDSIADQGLATTGDRDTTGDILGNRDEINTADTSRDMQDIQGGETPDQILIEKVNVTPSIYNPLENITLPDNPYGVFVTNSNPGGPLIEFNPEYTNYNNYVSSDYLLEHLGFHKTDTGRNITRRLGDGMYETQLVRNAMMVLTGQRYANDARSDMALYINLMDAGVKLANEVGLKIGVAPTAAQLSAMTEDIVWLVEQTIDGHRVLVPRVFLATGYERPSGGYIYAKDGIDLDVAGMLYNSGTIKTDGAMSLQTGTLINEWGTLDAATSLTVNSVSDIANLSGTIRGGSVSLTSLTGSIYNITQTGSQTYGVGENTLNRTTIGNTASISGGSVSLNAARDIINVGADLTSAGGMSLNAGGNIGVYTIANESSYSSQSEDGFVQGQTIEHIQSNITAGGMLNMQAGGDITLQAADIQSNGANLSAGGKLELLAAYNVNSLETQATHEDSLGDESEHRLDLEQQVVGTTLNTGSTTMSAGEHILLQSVTGKVDNLQLNSSNIILQSLNSVSLHTFDKSENGALTTTTTSIGDHVETVEGTDIIVSGSVTVNGQDITSQLYGGRLISQTPEQIQTDIEAQLHTIVNQALNPTTQNADGSYSGYSVSAIETLQTQGIDTHWNEETTSLNALGQLVVQLATTLIVPGSGELLGALGASTTTVATVTSNVVLDAAVSSVISQVTTAGLSAVITGELNLDVGELLTNAVKAATFAGITNALDTEFFVNDTTAPNGVFDPDKLSFTENMSREVLQASTSTLIYGGDFQSNLIAAVGDSVAAPAFEYIGHTLTDKDNLNLNPNDLSTQALITTSHALVGGTIADLTGGEFSSGAVATAVGHVVGEYAGSNLYADYENGDITLDELKNITIALSGAVGGATVLLTQEGVTAEELARATAMAESVTENNFLPLLILAAEIGVSADVVALLGFATVYTIIENNKGVSNIDILSELDYAVASMQQEETSNNNGIGILNNQGNEVVSGIPSLEDIGVQVTGIPEYNDDGSLATVFPGELDRPDVGGGVVGEEQRGTVETFPENLDAGGVQIYTADDIKKRNGHLAGQEHPVTGVPFNEDGYPVFDSKKDVSIDMTGNRYIDEKSANEVAGYDKTPDGYTWHHHQDGETMQLVDQWTHLKTGHTGGASIVKNNK